MKGYHYTSHANWRIIKNAGLVPYLVQRPELSYWWPSGVYGIWVWRDRPRGEAHLGCLLWQLSTKQDTKVVLLSVDYEEDWPLRRGNDLIALRHDGKIGAWPYHKGEEAVLITKPVEPKRIELVEVYDLVRLVN